MVANIIQKRVTFSECHVIIFHHLQNEDTCDQEQLEEDSSTWLPCTEFRRDFRTQILSIAQKLRVGYGMETVGDDEDHSLRGLEQYFQVHENRDVSIKGATAKQQRRRRVRGHALDVLMLVELDKESTQGSPPITTGTSRKAAHIARVRASQDEEDAFHIYAKAFGLKAATFHIRKVGVLGNHCIETTLSSSHEGTRSAPRINTAPMA